MMMRFLALGVLFSLQTGCDRNREVETSETKDLGLVGNTCYAKPIVRDQSGFNVCTTPPSNWPTLDRGEFWYGPFTMGMARQATVKACQDANALDYGVEHGQSCFKLCEKITSCLPLTPNPEV